MAPRLLSRSLGTWWPWRSRPTRRRPSNASRTGTRKRPFRITFTTFVSVVLGITFIGMWPGYFVFQAWRRYVHGVEEAQLQRDYGPEEFDFSTLVTPEACQSLRRPPLVCAHGGDTAEAPPNTMAAYDLAVKAGAECIEIDASRSADNVLVALHDRDLQVMSGRPGVRVGDFTLKELRSLHGGESFPKRFQHQSILTLQEALRLTSRRVKQVTVDVKVGPPHHTRGLAADTLATVRQSGCRNCLIWAKEDKVVSDVKSLDPSSRAGYIVMREPSTGEERKLLRMEEAEVVGVYVGMTDGPLVSQAHRNGKEVHVWTVNDKKGMHQMLAEGVDAIITNHPRKLKAAITMHTRKCSERNML